MTETQLMKCNKSTLVALAEKVNVDIVDEKTKKAIVAKLKNNVEVIEMTDINVNGEVTEELLAKAEAAGVVVEEGMTVEEIEAAIGAAEKAVVEETPAKATYSLDDGSECSRSAYIRQEFNKDRERKAIAKELGVKYHIVYAATANMFNEAHPEGAGSGNRSVMVRRVNAELEFIDGEGNVVTDVLAEDGETVEQSAEEQAAIVSRPDLMRELYEGGLTRPQIKEYFDVKYATVYAATKDEEGGSGSVGRGAKMIEHPESKKQVKRADYIRELFDGGMKRKEIALKLTNLTGELVDYATVYSVTKPEKEEEATEEVVEENAEATTEENAEQSTEEVQE